MMVTPECSPETAMMEEKFWCLSRFTGAVFFKVFANVTVYLTADTKDFRALMLIPLIRLAGVRTADLVVA